MNTFYQDFQRAIKEETCREEEEGFCAVPAHDLGTHLRSTGTGRLETTLKKG